ncbi:MAG: hypothetical protein IJ740_10105 [Ruminococcus sp.]|nr:hypothetical protein [Ruminococcus sp.]
MSNEKGFELPRSLYKELKAMNREQMQTVLTDIYKQGAESVKTASVDLDELRKAIGNINGIGEKRLDEIMRVIDEFVNK